MDLTWLSSKAKLIGVIAGAESDVAAVDARIATLERIRGKSQAVR